MPPEADSSVPLRAAARKTLRKRDKLRVRADFDGVRRRGVKQVGRGMLAIVEPAEAGSAARCGVICGKKYSPLAVRRNRARRLLWESFRLLKPHLRACRIVLIPRQSMKDWKRQQATRELAGLLHRAGVLPAGVAAAPPDS